MAESAGRRKLITIAVLGAVLLLLLVAFIALNAFNLQFLNPATTGETVVFGGLSALAFLLFMAVLVLLVRNVLKLYADQRSSMMGTRLRTRMLWGAVLVSVIPLVFMFLFSYGLMNRSVDRWFSQDPDEMRNDASQLALELPQYTSSNARAEAESIATSLPALAAPGATAASDGKPLPAATLHQIDGVLQQHEITLQNGFAIVYREGRSVANFRMPKRNSAAVQVKSWLPGSPAVDEDGNAIPATRRTPEVRRIAGDMDAAILAAAQRNDMPILSVDDTDYALGIAAVKQGGTVVVGLPTPYGMSATVARFQSAIEAYWNAYRQRRQVRNLYLSLLLMMTSLALFACTWLALHLAKQVTRPVEALADAMEAIAEGNYAHRVAESATEELGELVRSFNTMAADLEDSRRAVETSNAQLSAANAALDTRRRELETMLETIPNGVATLDANRSIVLANRALTEMLDPGGQTSFIGASIERIFPNDTSEALDQLDHLFRRSHRMGSASGEIEMKIARNGNGAATMYLLATVALLEIGSSSERTHHGYVLVLENATELLRAQKQSAWKEVARRVAHEIKNPLTPISLSAEQIHRHIGRLDSTLQTAQLSSPSIAVIRKSSEVITASVETMRALVDQFAALAEFPTAQPRPADLNTIVENSLAIFAGRLQSIRLVRRLASGLPLVLADPEALKRALGNLIDNAAEAMQESLLRELQISTALLPSGLVELTISDTGPGLTDEMRERLFLPYFSTKQRGTGLGLAIASKIVQEHQGSIRAEKNFPAGARFIIELRPALATDTEPASSEPIDEPTRALS
ncbi:MAG TPA: ATP-binding protein [Acidobacteriaceae bacterium]|nr:ATP-binding protein [Acidobacteriaceae bacterium]